MAAWSVWLQFLLIAGAIAFAGSGLVRYGDVLAEKTGMGRTWLGLVVLAAVTSLPEMATGVSAILWVQAPDITVGDLLGSCMFNLLILAVVDLFYPPGPVLTAADRGHLLAACFGVVMLAVAVMGLIRPPSVAGITLGYVGLSSPILLLCYLVAMRSLFRYQRRELAVYLTEHEAILLYEDISLNAAMAKFGVSALVVVAAGVFLPAVADQIAHLMGWQRSVMGTIFVAAATSLPEIVVTFSALRLGAVDLVVGNLFGSNLINLGILGLMGFLYVNAPLLQSVSPKHIGTGVMAIIMTGIAATEMMYRPQKKTLRWMSVGAFSLVFLYAANIFVQLLTVGE
ncbi:MAG: sodium:calcium antiporter [Desulfobaccales bacterium]